MVELYRRVGGELLADVTPQDAHFLGGTIRLASGGFVVSMVDRATSVARFQIYDDSGAPVGGEQAIGNGRLVALASRSRARPAPRSGSSITATAARRREARSRSRCPGRSPPRC